MKNGKIKNSLYIKGHLIYIGGLFNKNSMKVVSLFDGMRCALIALNRSKIKVTSYSFSEIDKYAIIIGDKNYPNCIPLGNVLDVDPDELGFQDFLCGGSPCQSFSFAGTRKGMSTIDNVEILTLEQYLKLKSEGFKFEGQSYLFWEYIRVLTGLRKYNPNIKFLLENVEMGSKWQKILTRAIGVNPIKINSALVSAQNRKRIYWTNIGAEQDGLFGDLVCKIPKPKDKLIFLKHIIESEVDEKYFLSDKMISTIVKHGAIDSLDNEKSNCILANYHKMGGRDQQYVDHDHILKINKKGEISPNQDKASCFTAGGNSGGNHSDMDLIVHNMMPRSSKSGKGGTGHLTRADGKTYCLDTGTTNAIEISCVAMRGRNPENTKDRTSGCPTVQMLEFNESGKTICLTTVQKDNLVYIPKNAIKEGVYNANYLQYKQGCYDADFRAYYEDGKSETLVTKKEHTKILLNNSRIRRLTPLECERLQTVPDQYTKGVSDTQRYRMLGNGWTVDVIAHIFSYLPKEFFK